MYVHKWCAIFRKKTMELTKIQIRKLRKIWFIYGNNGKNHTDHNHKFIQIILEKGYDARDLYKSAEFEYEKRNIDLSRTRLTDECIAAVDKIVKP